MPQAVWKGSIQFGPVDVPVKLYSATVLSRYKSNKYNWLRISLFEKLLKSA
jgi:non-homologous end joining protein Ku